MIMRPRTVSVPPYAALVAVVALLVIAAMMSTAVAEELPYTLVQTATPSIHSYPGVNASVLGIQTGMTVSQVEKIAGKYHFWKPQVMKRSLSVNYRGIDVESKPFIAKIAYQDKNGDVLKVFFANPATGNVVYKVDLIFNYKNVSKAPFMHTQEAYLIKFYGPVTYKSNDSYTWQFGKRSLLKCAVSDCSRVALWSPYTAASKIGVDMGIYAALTPNEGYYLPPTSGHKNGQKVARLHVALVNYRLINASVAAGTKQLKTAVIDHDNKVFKANQKLAEKGWNILDVTGAVTGHALVVSCGRAGIGGSGVSATTYASADALGAKLFFPKFAAKALLQKYGIGPVAYGGKKYRMVINTFSRYPRAKSANVQLYPFKGHDELYWGGKLVNGSITITGTGRHHSFTFSHAVIKFKTTYSGEQTAPINSTVMIDGEAHCTDGANVPLPPNFIVPTQKLNGTYVSKGSPLTFDFVSRTAVVARSRYGHARAIYKFDGHLLLISTPHHRLIMKALSNGCFNGLYNHTYCKAVPERRALVTTQATTRGTKPSGLLEDKPVKAQKKLETSASAAAQKKKAQLNLVPKF